MLVMGTRKLFGEICIDLSGVVPILLFPTFSHRFPSISCRLDLTCRAYSIGVLWNHVSCFDFKARAAVWYRLQAHPAGIREVILDKKDPTKGQLQFLENVAPQLTSVSLDRANPESVRTFVERINPSKLQKLIFTVGRDAKLHLNMFEKIGNFPSLEHLEILADWWGCDPTKLVDHFRGKTGPLKSLRVVYLGNKVDLLRDEYACIFEMFRLHSETLVEAKLIGFNYTQFIAKSLNLTLANCSDWKAVDEKLRAKMGVGLDVLRTAEGSLYRLAVGNRSNTDELKDLRELCWPRTRYSPSAFLTEMRNNSVETRLQLQQNLTRLLDDDGVVDHRVVSALIRGVSAARSSAPRDAALPAWTDLMCKALDMDSNTLETFFQSDCIHLLVGLPFDFYKNNKNQLDLSVFVRSGSRLDRFLGATKGVLVEQILRAVPPEQWLFNRVDKVPLLLYLINSRSIETVKNIIEYVIGLLANEPAELQAIADCVKLDIALSHILERDWLKGSFGRMCLHNLTLWLRYVAALQMQRSKEATISNLENLLEDTLYEHTKQAGRKRRIIPLPSVDFAEPLWIAATRYSLSQDALERLLELILQHFKKVPKVITSFLAQTTSVSIKSGLSATQLRQSISKVISAAEKKR
jgi:hypothetical protein